MSSEVFSHGMGAKKNQRRYPGVRGKRPDMKALRVSEAAERLAAYQSLPLEEKMKRNPHKYADAR